MQSRYYSEEHINKFIISIENKNKKYRELNDTERIKLKEQAYIKGICNSMKIENVNFNESEVKEILHNKITYRSSDCQEVINLDAAWKYMQNCLNKKISIDFIEQLQYICMLDITPYSECGHIRNNQVIITNSMHMPPHHSKIRELLNKSIEEYYDIKNNNNGLLKILKFNHSFVNIHPFFDGNGRVSRLLLDFMLMQKGYIPAVINADRKDEYYDGLEYADLYYDYRRFYGFMLEQIDETYNLYLNEK